MTEPSTSNQPEPPAPAAATAPPPAMPPAPPVPPVPAVPQQMSYPAAAYGAYPPAPAMIGKVRGTGVSMLLFVVTFGIYSFIWYFQVHEEMKRHKGTGIGGGVALLLAFFVGIVMPYITSSEAGELYARRGQAKPVSAATGLWFFPGIFILVGPIVWFVKTNGAINAYWRSLGAR